MQRCLRATTWIHNFKRLGVISCIAYCLKMQSLRYTGIYTALYAYYGQKKKKNKMQEPFPYRANEYKRSLARACLLSFHHEPFPCPAEAKRQIAGVA